MPTYEYRCTECGQHVEVVQSFSDDPLTECPACGGPLRKVFAPVGIVLKGSGFYKTDNRSSSSKAAAKTEKKESSDSSSKSESSSTSASKSEPKSNAKGTSERSA